jgi:hypothetical protein
MSDDEVRHNAGDKTETRKTPWLPGGFAPFYRPYSQSEGGRTFGDDRTGFEGMLCLPAALFLLCLAGPGYRLAAWTIARIPARIGSNRVGQALMSDARSGRLDKARAPSPDAVVATNPKVAGPGP